MMRDPLVTHAIRSYCDSNAAFMPQMYRFRGAAISCDHCNRAIETEVAKVPGVSTAAIDIEAKTVHVDGDATDIALRQPSTKPATTLPAARHNPR
jgi:copper chaperone CopZ